MEVAQAAMTTRNLEPDQWRNREEWRLVSGRRRPHVFYMFYMNILYVIGCKNIHIVLLKLYNQFYMHILYEIVRKNVHTFMKKNTWILLANFR